VPVSLRLPDMKKTSSALAVIAGMILSGQAAVWGARLGGHDPKAGFPFPDLEGLVLFLIGALILPLVAAAISTIILSFISRRHPAVSLPIPLAILLLGPLLGLALGYSVQSQKNQARNEGKAFDAQQRAAYSQYASQATADPEIVLRERWFEQDSKVPQSPVSTARQMVFKHSFQPDHLTVSYTPDQLREIHHQVPESGLYMIGHPMCPPDLIEQMWPVTLSSGQAGPIRWIIENPATPRHLLEKYQSERIQSNRSVSGWIDEAVEKRLKRDPLR